MIENPSQPQHATPQTCQRRPFFRRLQHLYWLAVALVASWFVLASLGIIPFQVTHAKVEARPPNPAPPLQPGAPLGKISIPRIALSANIAEGADQASLRHSIVHLQGSNLPWTVNTISLATNRATVFRTLRHLHLDDLILLETPQGVYRYQVSRITLVGPQHTEELPTPPSDLSLIAAGPFRGNASAGHRYLVLASRLPSR